MFYPLSSSERVKLKAFRSPTWQFHQFHGCPSLNSHSVPCPCHNCPQPVLSIEQHGPWYRWPSLAQLRAASPSEAPIEQCSCRSVLRDKQHSTSQNRHDTYLRGTKTKGSALFGPRVCNYAPVLETSMQVSGACGAACRGPRTVKRHMRGHG